MAAASGRTRGSGRQPGAILVDLNDKAERERLSRSGLRRFFGIVRHWKLRDEEARELLGGSSSSAYYEWKKNPERTLEVDGITRISCLTYPSVRCEGGTNLACFRPAVAGNVRRGEVWRLTWSGSPRPTYYPREANPKAAFPAAAVVVRTRVCRGEEVALPQRSVPCAV